MDSVVGSYPMVGRHHHHHHGHHGHHGAPSGAPHGTPASQLTPEQLAQLAHRLGFALVPENPNQNGSAGVAAGYGGLLMPTGQRILPAGFASAHAIAPGAPFTLQTQIQRGFQGRRLIVQAFLDASGAEVPGFLEVQDVRVGQRTQVVASGELSPSIFSPFSFDCYMVLDAARTGTIVVVQGLVSASAPSAVTIRGSIIGFAGE